MHSDNKPRRRQSSRDHHKLVDSHVGSRVQLRRTLKGMTQAELGKEVGLTFQQIQKYERGTNRIGASRLFALARALDVPIAFFFDGIGDPLVDVPQHRETLLLAKAFNAIQEPTIRQSLLQHIKSLALANGGGEHD